MSGTHARIEQAAALHRHAAAVVAAAAAELDRYVPQPRTDLAEQRDLTEALRRAGERMVPGWLGADLDAQLSARLGDQRRPGFVRIGLGQPAEGDVFPAIVPLLGTGHLVFTADARDLRVSGAMRSILLRLLATAPAGALVVRAVDPAERVFTQFTGLAEAGLMPPAATDRAGLHAILAEAEHWVQPNRPESLRRPTARPRRRDCTMLLIIASLPSHVDDTDLARISALAQTGPAAGLHLIVGGWPPLASTTSLPLSSEVSVRTAYSLLGGMPFSSPTESKGPSPTDNWPGLHIPIALDPDPPVELVKRVCRELAERNASQGEVRLMDLLPDPDQWWSESSIDGLTATVGMAGETPIQLHLTDLTPHWLVGGRANAGKTSFLVNVLYGLCTRYDPDELQLFLMGFREGEFTPTPQDPSWLPHIRAAGPHMLDQLDEELAHRAEDNMTTPRLVCVIDDFDPALTERLVGLAERGRALGLHLILCSTRTTVQERGLGQFRVRVALPGGANVLQASNDSAASLRLGYAVVNTAGGLGGPRGATRGHEKTVRFPEPRADLQVLNALRQRLWQARDPAAKVPVHG